MTANYTYPVILDYNEDDFINLYFPDFDGASTCIERSGNYIEAAQDYLSLIIADYESENKQLPNPSLENISLNPNQKLIYINIWMPYHRSKIREVYVKKTLTIPQWLDILAKQNNINFSSALVRCLKQELNIE